MTSADLPNGGDLTVREREVLAMVAEGKTNREIGAALFISESTAGVHVSNIMAKLGAGSRTEAAAIAIRAGLVEGAAVPVEESRLAPEPAAGPQPAAPEPTGWLARMRMQWRRHPRSAAIAVGSVVVLLAIAVGLTFAVLTGDRPTGAVAGGSPTPTEVATDSASPSATPTPSSSPSATPSESPSASASASADSSLGPTATPAPAATPAPTPTLDGAWTAVESMLDGRADHTATLLADGSVLIVGGTTGTECRETVERYDPLTEGWTEQEEMSDKRCDSTATLLRDGRVLVAGGSTSIQDLTASAELFDPDTGTFSPAASMSVSRVGHTATILSDGRVLVVGGQADYSGTMLASAEIYDPATGLWTPTGDMAVARISHTATGLQDGTVLVVGGCCGRREAHASAELFDPASGTWTGAGELVEARVRASATRLPDGRVIVVGGDTGDQVGLATAELYDPDTGRWTATAPMSDGRTLLAATVMEDGRVLAVGGFWGGATSNYLASAELYDPDTDSWSRDARLAAPRYIHTATLLDDGTVLVVGGGNDIEHETLRSAELFTLLD